MQSRKPQHRYLWVTFKITASNFDSGVRKSTFGITRRAQTWHLLLLPTCSNNCFPNSTIIPPAVFVPLPYVTANKRPKEPSPNKNATGPSELIEYFQRSSSTKELKERLWNILNGCPGPSQVKTWFTTTTSGVGEDSKILVFDSVVDLKVYAMEWNCIRTDFCHSVSVLSVKIFVLLVLLKEFVPFWVIGVPLCC